MLAASSSTLPAPSAALALKRSASLDIFAARRCWAKIDAGSSGFVSATDLQHYLTKFLAQQQRAGDSFEPAAAPSLSLQPAAGLSFDPSDERKESSHSAAASSVVAASSSSASASRAMQYRARDLCAAASAIRMRDLEDVIAFSDLNGDGKLDLDELMTAFGCFNNPSVQLCTERFESQIIAKGVEAGARPKHIPAPAASLSLGAAPVLGLTPTGQSPLPVHLSAVPTLPSIFSSTDPFAAAAPFSATAAARSSPTLAAASSPSSASSLTVLPLSPPADLASFLAEAPAAAKSPAAAAQSSAAVSAAEDEEKMQM